MGPQPHAFLTKRLFTPPGRSGSQTTKRLNQRRTRRRRMARHGRRECEFENLTRHPRSCTFCHCEGTSYAVAHHDPPLAPRRRAVEGQAGVGATAVHAPSTGTPRCRLELRAGCEPGAALLRPVRWGRLPGRGGQHPGPAPPSRAVLIDSTASGASPDNEGTVLAEPMLRPIPKKPTETLCRMQVEDPA